MTMEEIAEKLAEHDIRIKVSEHRIADAEKRQEQIYELTSSVKELAISVKNVVDEQKVQSGKIHKLEAKPAENWNNVLKQIITSVVSILVGLVMAQVFN